MNQQELIPHLFRTEYRKMISVIAKLFGAPYIEVAEDIVSDTFLLAAETWGQKGIPENPTAWLYRVAKNKAVDLSRRENIFDQKISPELRQGSSTISETDIDFSGQNISDSQLQMMFAICHPAIPVESQVGLSLSLLCGFGVDEIADAFLTGRDTIYKRLARAKEKLRTEKIEIVFPGQHEIEQRLDNVLTTLYLLFSEGYYSASHNTTLRKDFCLEAIRLNLMLIEYGPTNTPATNALLSLMCFHSSRFEARTGKNGEMILYEEQDENLWNQELISRGIYYLNISSQGNRISRYHIEAAIAYWHTQTKDSAEKWEHILQLYNRLLQLEYSPIAALNRTYALDRVKGKKEAIAEAEKLDLKDNHLYHSLLANLYEDIDPKKSLDHLHIALSLARTETDRQVIRKKIKAQEGI